MKIGFEKRVGSAYSTSLVTVNNKAYFLNQPLTCIVNKEDDAFFVKSELLEIIGTGATLEEAEKDFNEEFDYIYTTYFSKANSKLSTRLQRIKAILKVLVKEVK